MRKILFHFYWKLEKLIFPQLKYAQYRYYDRLKEIIPHGCLWLDIGCGHQMFAGWMISEERELASRAKRLAGIDLDWKGINKHKTIKDKVFGDLQRLPFASECFSVVTANMVVEHLAEPNEVLREVYRILRPGGMFIFHTPNAHCVVMAISSRLPQRLKSLLALILEDRKAEDIFPTFYRLNTEPAIKQKAEKAGFEIKELKTVSSSAFSVMLGPLVIMELLYLRILEVDRFRAIRSNIVAALIKPVHGLLADKGETSPPATS